MQIERPDFQECNQILQGHVLSTDTNSGKMAVYVKHIKTVKVNYSSNPEGQCHICQNVDSEFQNTSIKSIDYEVDSGAGFNMIP